MSILQKLLNKNNAFVDSLEEIYLVTMSTKGEKNRHTIKSLINYFIALTIYDPKKGNKVLEYLGEHGKIPSEIAFFDAVNDIRVKNKFKEGLEKLKTLP